MTAWWWEWVMCCSRTPFCVLGSGTGSLAWVSSPPDAPPCQYSHFLPKLSRKVSLRATEETCCPGLGRGWIFEMS